MRVKPPPKDAIYITVADGRRQVKSKHITVYDATVAQVHAEITSALNERSRRHEGDEVDRELREQQAKNGDQTPAKASATRSSRAPAGAAAPAR